ncbi:MAG TPA: hypothetical protein VGB91_05165 [Rhizomicrobium sp.]
MALRRIFAALVLLAALGRAEGGAWTLKRGHWQVITATTQSTASMSFDDRGRARLPTGFNKLFLQNTLEYGATGALTLFATPNYISARVVSPNAVPFKASSVSLEAGGRLLLDGRHGKLSLQASYKTAGAFDLSVSANRSSARQIELRLLYGTSFKLFGRDGFADAQIAQRWITHPRPNETPIDLTAGLWLTPRSLVMLQSFNVVSAGDALAPYTYYRSHKLELSFVRKLSRHWSLQLGAFYSPAGQNALVERGLTVSLWTQD